MLLYILKLEQVSTYSFFLMSFFLLKNHFSMLNISYNFYYEYLQLYLKIYHTLYIKKYKFTAYSLLYYIK